MQPTGPGVYPTPDPARRGDTAVEFPQAGRSPKFVALYAEAREALDARQWDLAGRMIGLAEQETAKAEHEEFLALVDGIARHFPAFGPAGPPAGAWVECLGHVPRDPAA